MTNTLFTMFVQLSEGPVDWFGSTFVGNGKWCQRYQTFFVVDALVACTIKYDDRK